VAVGALTTTILTFAALVCVGALLRATGVLRRSDAHTLNAVIIYAGLPAFIFQAVHGARLGPELWSIVAISWAVFAVVLGLALLVVRVRRMERQRAGGFLLASALGNTGFVGYPVTAALLGASALPAAVFSDVFGTVFALVFVGMPIAEKFGKPGDRPFRALRELLTFPAVIALAVGLALRTVALPSLVSNGIDLLASLVAPLIMLAVGVALRPKSLVQSATDLSMLAGLKLLVAPVLAVVFGSLLLGGPALRVTVLQAGMPSMMLTFVVGERYGLDTDFIASAIFVTTVLAAVTVPLVQVVAF